MSHIGVCGGCFKCPNTECAFYQQYNNANKIHFNKDGECKICCIEGNWENCETRKYTAFVSDTEAHVFHYGEHTCEAKVTSERPIDFVQKAINTDPKARPAEIQSNAILSDLRSRKSWDEVKNTVKKLLT